MTKSENIRHKSTQNDKIRQKKWIKTKFSFFVNPQTPNDAFWRPKGVPSKMTS